MTVASVCGPIFEIDCLLFWSCSVDWSHILLAHWWRAYRVQCWQALQTLEKLCSPAWSDHVLFWSLSCCGLAGSFSTEGTPGEHSCCLSVDLLGSCQKFCVHCCSIQRQCPVLLCHTCVQLQLDQGAWLNSWERCCCGWCQDLLEIGPSESQSYTAWTLDVNHLRRIVCHFYIMPLAIGHNLRHEGLFILELCLGRQAKGAAEKVDISFFVYSSGLRRSLDKVSLRKRHWKMDSVNLLDATQDTMFVLI